MMDIELYDTKINKHIKAAAILTEIRNAVSGIKHLQGYRKHVGMMAENDWYVQVRAKNKKIQSYKEFIIKKRTEYENLMTEQFI